MMVAARNRTSIADDVKQRKPAVSAGFFRLYPSRRLSSSTGRLLIAACGLQVWRRELRTSKTFLLVRLFTTFEQDDGCVVVATTAFREGVGIVKQLLQCVLY